LTNYYFILIVTFPLKHYTCKVKMKSKQKSKTQPKDFQKREGPYIVPKFLLDDKTSYVMAILYFIIMLFVSLNHHKIGDYGVETDFYWSYIPHAQHILAGYVDIDQWKGPGYEFILALGKIVSTDFFFAGMIIAIASAALVILFTYKIISNHFNKELAFITVLGLVTNFTFIKYSYSSGTDMFFNFLQVLVLYFLLRNQRLSLLDIAIAGAITGYAYITRYNAIALYAAVIVGLLLLNYKMVDWKKRIAAATSFVLSSLIFVLPWGLYCLREKGNFFYNVNYLNIAYKMYGRGKVGWDEYWNTVAIKFSSLSDVILADPITFFTHVTINFADHLWKDISLLISLPLGIFALGGIVILLFKKPDRKQIFYFIFSGAFFAILTIVFYGERFSLYLIPTYFLLVSIFFVWEKIPSLGFPHFGIKHLLILSMFFYTAYSSIDQVKSDISSGPVEILDVRNAFFNEPVNSGTEKTVIARKPHIAYYLNMKFEPFPYVFNIDELIEKCKSTGADYLYFSGIEAGMRPQLSFLLDPGNAPPQFQPIVSIIYPPAVLYKINFENSKNN
ncbi:MAG: glycosyltransferase family 39 protein, partial [Bacteroidota bacterium]|nr:glycosyltransferase family 39 protein [Bacteroidota bacterium]